jgi:hypothetical protein
LRRSSHGLLDLVTESLEHRPLTRVVGLLAGGAQPDPEGDEPLLRAVVQVAFDAPPLGVARLQDASPEARSSPSR